MSQPLYLYASLAMPKEKAVPQSEFADRTLRDGYDHRVRSALSQRMRESHEAHISRARKSVICDCGGSTRLE